MTPPTATTTQLAVLEQLPSPVRLEALEWDAALRTLSPPVGKALARLAAQFGCDAVTARRRYDRWRRHGVLGVVNAARGGVRLRDLLRGSVGGQRQNTRWQRIAVDAETVVASQPHLGERFLRVQADEVTDVGVGQPIGKCDGGLPLCIRRAEQYFGCVKLIGHYQEVRKDIAALAEFHRAAIGDGNLHREPAIIVGCPDMETETDLFQIIDASQPGRSVWSMCWREEHQREKRQHQNQQKHFLTGHAGFVSAKKIASLE